MRSWNSSPLALSAGVSLAPTSRPSVRLRQLILGTLVGAAGVLGGGAALTLHDAATVRATSTRNGIQSLPLVAQGSVSAVLGGERLGYRVLHLRAVNPEQHLRMGFSRQGVTVASGRARTVMRLSAYGYATTLRPLRPAAPQVRANRVSYTYGSLEEQFANGPLGLEQSFELAARPTAGRGPLTFSVSLSGNLHPRLHDGSLWLHGDGISLRYGGLVATDAHGRVLRSWLELVGDRVLVRVDDRDAAYPLWIDPFIQQAELTGSRGSPGEEFGESVAIAASTIVVGTPNHADTATGAEQGAAYVFTKPASGWADATQAAVLRANRGESEEDFGHSVAVSGDTIVVGAPFREVGRHTGQGSAYVFVKPARGWRDATQTATLTAKRGAAHEFFGESVAVSGNVVVCGAPSHRVASNASQGAVDIFRKPADGWRGALTQSAELIAADGQANDSLGISVAVSRDTLVAGADLHRVDAHTGEGAAYVFTKPASGWRDSTQTAELTDYEGEAGELFGHSVALSGATIVVGAPFHELGDVVDQGAVYVFVMPASGWRGSVSQIAELTVSDGAKNELLGRSLAIFGNTVVAGASAREIGASSEQGEVYVFVKPASGWENVTPAADLIASNGTTGDDLGRSVAVSGKTIVAGAPDHEVRGELAQGAVYAFVFRGASAGAPAVH